MALLGVGRVERTPTVAANRAGPMIFACQGCGALCCTNEHLVLSPLEVARLTRVTGAPASELSAAGWLIAYPDPESGIPRVAIRSQRVDAGLSICPFLGLDAGEPTESASVDGLRMRHERGVAALTAAPSAGIQRLSLRCGVYAARPAMCRAFPLQVKVAMGTNGKATGWRLESSARCPGHGQGNASSTVASFLEGSDLDELMNARLAWHGLNQDIERAGITLPANDEPSGSRRALWDATSNLLFASSDQPALQVPDEELVPQLHALFGAYLAPAARYMDAERRSKQGAISQHEAKAQLLDLVAACAAVQAALQRTAT